MIGPCWRFSAAAAGVLLVLCESPRAQQTSQAPVFRGGTDLIELDVSVLDRDRRAIRGLGPADFSVTEDGSPQKVTTVSFVDIAVHDPARSARMRFVSRDVAANDLTDQLGNGRLVAVVLDDVNLPGDDPDIVRSTRETARYVIDQLGPSDMAAVVHARHSGRTQDFTSDRSKLLDSIDAFVPEALIDTALPASGMGPGAGDMVQRWSPTLMRSACLRNEPAVPTLDAVTTVMATAPGRRKALVFLSVGVPASLGGASACAGQISDVMRGVFRKAQVANVNIYAVDPAGLNGYLDYLRRHPDVRQRGNALVRPRATNIRLLQDFMRTVANTTGGRAVLNTDALEPAIDQIFEEDRSYYMVGYESTNGVPDGTFREVEVRVSRPNATTRTRSGYWAPKAEDLLKVPATNSASSVALAGLFGPQGLPLRASVTAIGLPEGGTAGSSRNVALGAVLTVKWPARAIASAVQDTLTIVRNVYDATGNPGPPVREVVRVELKPGRAGEDVRYDVFQRLSLPPGRHQVRFNVQSALAGVNGSVYADVEVPNIHLASLSFAGPVLGHAPSQERPDAILASWLPVTPTSARDFAASEAIHLVARIYQGATGRLLPVTATVEVLDAADAVKSSSTRVLAPGDFDAARGVTHQVEVPLSTLAPGPYLVSLSARLPSGYTQRKDLLIRVR